MSVEEHQPLQKTRQEATLSLKNQSPYYVIYEGSRCGRDGRSEDRPCDYLDTRPLSPFFDENSRRVFYYSDEGVEVFASYYICLLSDAKNGCEGRVGTVASGAIIPTRTKNVCVGSLQWFNFMNTVVALPLVDLYMITISPLGTCESTSPGREERDNEWWYTYGWGPGASGVCGIRGGKSANVISNLSWRPVSTDAYLSSITGQEAKTLSGLKNCVYISSKAFSESRPVFGFTVSMNSFGWSIGQYGWINAPKNKIEAISTIYASYQETYCSDPSVYIALYREPCSLSQNCSSSFSHAAVNWSMDYPNTSVSKIGWSSKFGAGPLLTHEDMNSIINPFSTESPSPDCSFSSYEIPAHYGIPTLCFKKKIQGEERVLSQSREKILFSNEQRIFLKDCISAVPANSKMVFSNSYEGWKDFVSHPPIVLSSSLDDRAHGEFFESMIHLGKEALPLVIEKMMDAEEFMSLLLYEKMSGVKDRGDIFKSAQEIAESYAHDWLNQASISEDGFCSVDLDFF